MIFNTRQKPKGSYNAVNPLRGNNSCGRSGNYVLNEEMVCTTIVHLLILMLQYIFLFSKCKIYFLIK